MPTRELPERPSLDQLELQARELQEKHRERRPAIAARIAAHHPSFAGRSGPDVLDARPQRYQDHQMQQEQ